MWLANQDYQIPKQWYHKPELQNKQGYTVAMIQASNDIIPDKQWVHNRYLRCRYNYFLNCYQYFTVQNILSTKMIQVPDEWSYIPLNDNEDNQAIIDARNGIIPELRDNDPSYQNQDGDTVAMLLAKQGIIPPREWMHDINLQNNDYESIKSLLKYNCLPIPYHWHNDNMTIFDRVCYGEIPDIKGHKSNEQNHDGQTIAMILVMLNKDIPIQWYHNPSIQDNNGRTVAMLQALNGKIPDKQWLHDPLLQDTRQNTVGIYLSMQGIIPPQQWLHDIDIENNFNQSIRSILQKYGYIYKNNTFIDNYQLQTLNETCQLCLQCGKQQFIKTTCNHKICFNCFKKMRQKLQIKQCPICKKQGRYYQLDQNKQNNKKNAFFDIFNLH